MVRFNRKEDFEEGPTKEIKIWNYEYDVGEDTITAGVMYPDWHPAFKLDPRFYDKVIKTRARDTIEELEGIEVDIDKLRLVEVKYEEVINER